MKKLPNYRPEFCSQLQHASTWKNAEKTNIVCHSCDAAVKLKGTITL